MERSEAARTMTNMNSFLDRISEAEDSMRMMRLHALAVAKRKSSTNVNRHEESQSSVDMCMERTGAARKMVNMNSYLDRVSNTAEMMRLHEAAKLKYPTVSCDDSSQHSESQLVDDVYMDNIDARLSAWSIQPLSPWTNSQLQPKPLLDFHLESSDVKCNSCSFIIPQDSKLRRTNITYCLNETKHFVHCPNCTAEMVIGIPNVVPAPGFKYVVGGATL